jgi:phage terminase Nu1 subunit (DNA packaging protein)
MAGFLMPELIRKRQAAELLGVSAPRISQLLRAGHLSEVAGTGMLSRTDVEAFAQCRDGLKGAPSHPRNTITAAELHQRRAAPPLSPAESAPASQALPSIAESRQLLEALKAAIAQHDLDTRSGKLVSREEVARAAFQEGQRIRQALEGLPYRLGQGLAGALGLDAAQAGFVVQEVMAHEIRQLLVGLALDQSTTEI